MLAGLETMFPYHEASRTKRYGLVAIKKKKNPLFFHAGIPKVKAILLEFKCAVTRSELTSVTTHPTFETCQRY